MVFSNKRVRAPKTPAGFNPQIPNPPIRQSADPAGAEACRHSEIRHFIFCVF
jgi:hypothetical protein